MKKIAFLIIVIFVLGVLGFSWWTRSLAPVSDSKTAVSFIINKGLSASQIGNLLKSKGIIRSALAFKIFIQLTGKSEKIQAGEYRLMINKSLPEVFSELLKGPTQIWITIPEGLRREEIALKNANELDKTGTLFDGFVNEFLKLTKNKEGYLFPDTYLFPKDISAEKVVTMMSDNFLKKTTTLKTGFDSKLYSFDETIILASIIERETKGDAEKPIVAGILLKRWENNWPLQVDATLQYALANIRCLTPDNKCKYWEQLSKEDMTIRSPYNTYENLGLPPTPICNPGLASIKASLSPEKSDFWFYLHDPSGQVHYAKTASEHNQNVSKYLSK